VKNNHFIDPGSFQFGFAFGHGQEMEIANRTAGEAAELHVSQPGRRIWNRNGRAGNRLFLERIDPLSY
jgi:hypothetical protein